MDLFSIIRRLSAAATLALVVSSIGTESAHAAVLSPAVQNGVAWLNAQVQNDGSLTNESSSIATAFQAREESLVTLSNLAVAPPGLIGNVALATDRNTEYLARQIIAAANSHQGANDDVASLLALQNPDGGWGLTIGYSSDPLDTAFALQALRAINAPSTAVGNGLGFLSAAKLADGGWGLTDQSLIYITAHVLLAANAWAGEYADNDVAGAATTWLLAQRNASGDMSDVQSDTLTLLGLSGRTGDPSVLGPLVNAIAASQASDGSWNEDPYLTALALRALGAPPTNTTQASVSGRVIDGQTGRAISGAAISLTGFSTYSQSTDANGNFAIASVDAGAYTLQVAAGGFNSVTANTSVSPGQSLDFGTIALVPLSGGGTGTVVGTVTDINTGQPLQGATVTVNSFNVATAADGTFEINNVAAGAATAVASAAGYQTLTSSGSVPVGGILQFTFELAAGSGPPGDLVGTITDANTGKAIVGATVSVTGADTALAQSNAQGSYHFSGFITGTIQVAVTATGYDSARVTTDFVTERTTTFSPKLYPTGTSPPGANAGSVTGTVVDSTTDKPLASVAIVATSPDNSTIHVVTDSAGHFAVRGLTQNQVTLAFSLANYVSVQFSTPTPPLEVNNLGDVRMRPLGVLQTLPDLVVNKVDSKTQAATDPQTLQLSGSVQAEIGNRGTAPAPADVQALAFYDVNQNGIYDAGIDIALGTATTSAAIDPQGTLSLDIPVAGTLPFRDAPVTVWINSAQNVVELNAANNYGNSTSQCHIAPPPTTITPTLKWAWNGSAADQSDVNVFGPVIVGHLTDDNGDGHYDENDVPTLVFAGRTLNPESASALVAVSGKDGHELWRRTDIQATGNGSVAIADIDGDGKPEVLVSNWNRTKLYALRNDGSVLWSTATGPAFSSEAVFDGITVADLNQDGKPEIIQGNHVFDNTGKLLWVGAGDGGGTVYGSNYGFVSIAADIRPDIPGMEVIAGRTLYDADGHIIWNRTDISCDGFNAVGDFGYPNPPQIVLASCGTLYLLDRNGKTIWKTFVYGGGQGGPPTVADFGGEGKPQIGVAASRNYTVYGADGSVRWSAQTYDLSSNVTGSSAFDFLDNGKVEVLYGDEQMFRIYDGATGAVLWSTVNPSGTTFEYPVVADVDNDGHADIVIGANASPSSSSPLRGVRVFSAATGGWAPTRTVWNEHGYHITNINDDGSVPQFEQSSWKNSNTYRLNTFPGHGVLDGPDLTAGLLQVTDNGTGQSLTLSARIGNGGQIASRATMVAFYFGDPSHGGTLVGSVALGALDPSQYLDVQLTGVAPPSGSPDVYVVVDPANTIQECDKTNNVDHVPYASSNPLVQLSVATDAVMYAANSPAQLTGTVTNTGSFATDANLNLRIEDSSGNVVVDFGNDSLGAVAAGGAANDAHTWNTGTTLAGPYMLRGLLYATNGSLLAQASAAFSIVASGTATSTVHTDKQTYNPSDKVQIVSGVQSLSSNVILSNLTLNLQVLDASATQQFAHSNAIPQLLASQALSFTTPQQLSNAAPGVYTVKQDLVDAQNNLLSHVETTYTVSSTSDTGFGLKGTIIATPKSLPVGATLTLNATATDQGNSALNNLPLTISIIDPAAGTVLQQFNQTSSLNVGATVPFNTTWVTQGNANTTYTAVLTATVGAGAAVKTLTLAQDTFTLTPPANNLKADITLAAGAPPLAALVLMDANANPADTTRLTNALAARNYAATFVNTAGDFSTSLRTGAYQLYLLLAGNVAPDTITQRLLREAVHRGEGVIIANGAGQLSDVLAQISGLQSGNLLVINAQAIDVLANAPGGAAHVTLSPPLPSRIVVPRSAQTQATITGRLPATPDQGTLASELASLGRIDIGYFGNDAGTNGTHLALSSMGRIQNTDGSDHYTVWLIRNSGTTACNVTIASVAGGYSLALTVTPHTDTFIASPIVAGTADHTLSESGTAIQSVPAVTTAFADSRLVDVGANPGAIALWGNHIGSSNVLIWNGSQHLLHGAVISNSDIVFTGSQNLIDGPVHYVTSFSNSGSQNTFTYQPRSINPQPLPTLLNLADFQPGGVVATAVGTQYFDQSAECAAKGSWQRTSTQMPLAPGVYYIPCDVHISGNAPVGNVTLVSTGLLQIDGAKGSFTPFYQGVQFATSLIGDAIHLTGDSTQVGGLVFAPQGSVQITGSSMSFACSIIADTIRLSGAKTQIDVRQCPYATVQEQTPAVLWNTFGTGAAVYAAFPWQSAIDQYEATTPGELTNLFTGILGDVAPNAITLRAGIVVPLTATVQNQADPFTGTLALSVDDDSTFVPPTASWQLDFTNTNSFTANTNIRLGSHASTGITAKVSAATPVVIDPLKQTSKTISHLAGDSIADLINAANAISSPDAGIAAALAGLQAAQTAMTVNDASTELSDLLDAAEACGTSNNAQADALRTRIDWVIWGITH